MVNENNIKRIYGFSDIFNHNLSKHSLDSENHNSSTKILKINQYDKPELTKLITHSNFQKLKFKLEEKSIIGIWYEPTKSQIQTYSVGASNKEIATGDGLFMIIKNFELNRSPNGKILAQIKGKNDEDYELFSVTKIITYVNKENPEIMSNMVRDVIYLSDLNKKKNSKKPVKEKSFSTQQKTNSDYTFKF